MWWMKVIIRKFVHPSSLVVDYCVSTFSVAKACMRLLQHRRLVGCDRDMECHTSSLPKLVVVFDLQSRERESNNTEDDDQPVFLLFKHF